MRHLSSTVQPWRMAPWPNGDVVAHGHVVACVAVKDAVVLDVRKGADGDLLLVGPEDGIVPHVGLFAQGHVTPEIGAREPPRPWDEGSP